MTAWTRRKFGFYGLKFSELDFRFCKRSSEHFKICEGFSELGFCTNRFKNVEIASKS
jgi:hypothetical protein